MTAFWFLAADVIGPAASHFCFHGILAGVDCVPEPWDKINCSLLKLFLSGI